MPRWQWNRKGGTREEEASYTNQEVPAEQPWEEAADIVWI